MLKQPDFAREGRYGSTRMVVHQREILDREAEYAWALIERFALVAADNTEKFTEDFVEINGPGSGSRSRKAFNLSPPEEIVARAFDIAAVFVRVARDRGHILEVPPATEFGLHAPGPIEPPER